MTVRDKREIIRNFLWILSNINDGAYAVRIHTHRHATTKYKTGHFETGTIMKDESTIYLTRPFNHLLSITITGDYLPQKLLP